MNRFWQVFVFLLALSLLVACDRALDQRVIRMGLADAPLTLDPRFATDATSARISRLLYQRLVDLDEQGMPVPGIADWQLLSPTHYRFQLTDRDAVFSNGMPVAAVDVVASYRFVLDPANLSPYRSTLEVIARLEAIDQRTIDFHLHRPDPLFPAYLLLEILPAQLIVDQHPFETRPVGSGDFLYLARPEPGRLLLKRRKDGQVFELLEVKNPTVRVLKLLRGEIHLVQNDLSPELIGYLRKTEKITIKQREGINFSYIGFNMLDAATSNPRIRRAIAHAIDREAIIRQLLQQSARVAEALFPPEHWASNKTLQAYPFSPERAMALLAAAGYTVDRPLRLIYKTSSDPLRIRLATIIQSQLKAVGIELKLQSYDWGTFFGDIKAGRFQLYSLTWVGLRTPDSFSYIFASDATPPKGANRGRYSSQAVDDLLEQIEQQQSLAIQAFSYQQIQRILHEDLPYIPLWYEDQFVAFRNEVQGYHLMPDGNYDGLKEVRFVKLDKSAEVTVHAAD